jgi:hypothetical protein
MQVHVLADVRVISQASRREAEDVGRDPQDDLPVIDLLGLQLFQLAAFLAESEADSDREADIDRFRRVPPRVRDGDRSRAPRLLEASELPPARDGSASKLCLGVGDCDRSLSWSNTGLVSLFSGLANSIAMSFSMHLEI